MRQRFGFGFDSNILLYVLWVNKIAFYRSRTYITSMVYIFIFIITLQANGIHGVMQRVLSLSLSLLTVPSIFPLLYALTDFVCRNTKI